jgi:hypothetical protein
MQEYEQKCCHIEALSKLTKKSLLVRLHYGEIRAKKGFKIIFLSVKLTTLMRFLPV